MQSLKEKQLLCDSIPITDKKIRSFHVRSVFFMVKKAEKRL